MNDRSDRKVCIERNCFSDTSKIWSDKLKFLHDKGHGEKERTEDYKNKAMEVTEAPSVHRATELVCQYY